VHAGVGVADGLASTVVIGVVVATVVGVGVTVGVGATVVVVEIMLVVVAIGVLVVVAGIVVSIIVVGIGVLVIVVTGVVVATGIVVLLPPPLPDAGTVVAVSAAGKVGVLVGGAGTVITAVVGLAVVAATVLLLVVVSRLGTLVVVVASGVADGVGGLVFVGVGVNVILVVGKAVAVTFTTSYFSWILSPLIGSLLVSFRPDKSTLTVCLVALDIAGAWIWITADFPSALTESTLIEPGGLALLSIASFSWAWSTGLLNLIVIGASCDNGALVWGKTSDTSKLWLCCCIKIATKTANAITKIAIVVASSIPTRNERLNMPPATNSLRCDARRTPLTLPPLCTPAKTARRKSGGGVG
jgi:hypothetical protein